MPYIPHSRRAELDRNPWGVNPNVPGELNYVITKLALGIVGKEPSYTKYNQVIGAIECAKLELYRRAVASYEDKKIAENGDVF